MSQNVLKCPKMSQNVHLRRIVVRTDLLFCYLVLLLFLTLVARGALLSRLLSLLILWINIAKIQIRKNREEIFPKEHLTYIIDTVAVVPGAQRFLNALRHP